MFEITNQKQDFASFIENGDVYKDGKYDFTFENEFHVYHIRTGDSYRYIALSKETGKGSQICETKRVLDKFQYKTLIPKLLYSIKYTGDRRYMGHYRMHPHDFIEMIFSSIMPQYGYNIRKEQIKMSINMYDGLVKNTATLCEAEVGTGKTMAYLVAAFTAKMYDTHYGNNRNPITISTSSIELQHMIIKKEIPSLSAMLSEYGLISEPLQAVLRKGKEHYFCPARYDDYLKAIKENPDKHSKTIAFLERLNLSEHGFDLDSIPGMDTWLRSKICVKGSCCHCPKKKDCRYADFLNMANRTGNYDFQVTNHNMFLASQQRSNSIDGNAILRESNYVIIDEAHKLRETASTVFGACIESDAVDDYINSIKYIAGPDLMMKSKLKRLCDQAKKYNEILFSILSCDSSAESDDTDRINFTFTTDVTGALQKLLVSLQAINDSVGIVRKYKSTQCTALIEELKKFLHPSDIIYWMDVDHSTDTLALCCEPKAMNRSMERCLWEEPNMHFVLTSGTMRDDTGFDYFKSEIGIENNIPKCRVLECTCESPFDYANNTRLYISEKVSFPDQNDEQYIQSLSDEIERLVSATHGHTAILFTSYKVLSAVYDKLVGKLAAYPLFKMTRSNKTAISDFKKSGNGVLFASGSMWEGVDCVGDILSSVIIVKLPFPLRSESLEQKKRKSASTHEFIQAYAVPQMLIKLRQGAGRLIRSETDTGLLSILDARASQNAAYRNRVMKALEKFPVVNSVEEIEDFFSGVKKAEYFN